MTSKPSDFMLQKWAEDSAAEALRQRHERIGRLVVEHVEVLRLLWNGRSGSTEGTNAVLAAILKEVES